VARNRGFSEDRTLNELEIQKIRNAIEEANGNKTQAAEALGITRRRLYSRLKVLGIEDDD